MSVVQSKDFVVMTEVMEDEKFTIAVNGQKSDQMELKYGVLKWEIRSEALIDVSLVETVWNRNF